ncbi:ROK family protein [Thermoflexus sp.]|uniref:ROK family protein n=1 Tax=Thermoflexus sp. TaxID=1969742 RepID=UPI0035E3FA46
MAYIAVDLGGTNIRAARCAEDGRILARAQTPTRPEEGVEAVIARIIGAIEAVWTDEEPVEAIGVGAPGPLDPQTGVVLTAPNLGWENVPLADRLRERFRVPCFVGNDANLAALGEWKYGAGRGHEHLVYLTISTGIGGGVITHGVLLEGAHGLGAELGHIVLEAREGPRCGCGRTGCLEALASGTAIARMAREAWARGEPVPWPDPSAVTAADVAEAATQGDPVAAVIMDRAAFYLGVGIASFWHIFNPTLIILGGGVMKTGDWFLEKIRAYARDRAMTSDYITPIVRAALGDDVGVLGALAYAQMRLPLSKAL